MRNLLTLKFTMKLRKLHPLAFLICICSFSQNTSQIANITKDYDFIKLQQLYDKSSSKRQNSKALAYKLASYNNWPVILKNEDDTFAELQFLTADNKPIYYSTSNEDAAISTRTNFLHNGGALGLNIEGQNMTVHVWDGGPASNTHEDLIGRISTNDGSSIGGNSNHALHVSGTISGQGLGTVNGKNSKGMAPQSVVLSHDWNNDISEAVNAAMNGMLLSNHSYGNLMSSVPDWYFGAYAYQALEWDELMSNAPYYLMVTSAGNDGNSNFENQEPLEQNPYYDKLNGNTISKNNLVVANAQDALVRPNGIVMEAVINSSSSEGPTDDLRIKPDLTGNGSGLLSAYGSDTSYASLSGTSMSSPNVCGSLLLLQQLSNEHNNHFFRAATLKGLALHTADDIASSGPDAITGWGLMNTKLAAETILNNGLSSWISEERLEQGESFSITVQSDGTSPLMASISWTDPTGGYVNTSATPNNGTPVLVNDLDLRIVQAGVSKNPWKLTSATTNTNADGTDNNTDPFERVDIDLASGEYEIVVTHKNILKNNNQRFSLVITGIASEMALINKTVSQKICADSDAIFNFDYLHASGPASQLSALNVPDGLSVDFSQNNLDSNTNFDVTLGNLEAVPPGQYEIYITANNGFEIESRTIELTILSDVFEDVTTQSPNDGAIILTNSTLLEWQEDPNSESYLVEIATDPNFDNTILLENTLMNRQEVSGLQQGEVYYWRVFGQNQCAASSTATIQNFQVGSLDCTNNTQNNSTDILDLDTVTATLEITQDISIADINATVAYNHTWIGDVAITLISPLGTRVELIEVLTCTTETDFNITFDSDADSAIDCTAANSGSPTTFKPVGNLQDLNGESSLGIWTLEIVDDGPNDIGTITSWGLTICSTVIIPAPNFINNSINVETNTNYTILNSDLQASTNGELAVDQIFTIIEETSFGILKKEGIILETGNTFSQADIDNNLITFSNNQNANFSDHFKVNIENASGGWLPNQIINIFSESLNNPESTYKNITLWPNPTNGKVHIKFTNGFNAHNTTIVVTDLQGRKLLSYKDISLDNNQKTSVNLSKLSAGSYIISVYSGKVKVIKHLVKK